MVIIIIKLELWENINTRKEANLLSRSSLPLRRMSSVCDIMIDKGRVKNGRVIQTDFN